MLNLVSRNEWTVYMVMHVVNMYGLSFVHSDTGIDK